MVESIKVRAAFGHTGPEPVRKKRVVEATKAPVPVEQPRVLQIEAAPVESKTVPLLETKEAEETPKQSHAVVAYEPKFTNSQLAIRNRITPAPVPQWHAPWKLMRVISGHLGWVRCVDVDVSNEFFVTGSADRTIKVWDLASGVLKWTLTGHISTVRGIAVSDRHPYLFSCGEDKMVKCKLSVIYEVSNPSEN
jgi:pleiotropic regulator 1